ncbi:unnamed protein product [Rangifer tarandus platyrhynchus]|uniref:Uncharacterized protein n=2 Tax=Rangifer tarandus platyrhynchus TaxID=3082113 RepID=A0ACB1MLC3_RANTA|nr:unnamed protein product [Rangifer tarandus platyrhynchus]
MLAGNTSLLLVPTETTDGAAHPSPTPGKQETCEEGSQDESSTLCEGPASDPKQKRELGNQHAMRGPRGSDANQGDCRHSASGEDWTRQRCRRNARSYGLSPLALPHPWTSWASCPGLSS